LDKAIDIKRRAQRYIQTGDLDGALTEYEKLVSTEDADPYNYVLLADLLFKRNDPHKASERYLHAVTAYEKAALYKNAIAVCKKMMRLSLSPPVVLKRLGALHALDGLATEASLYYQQYAEHQARDGRHADAAESLRLAFQACADSVKVVEKIGDAYELAGDNAKAARAWAEAAALYRERGAEGDAARCASRAEALEPGVTGAVDGERSRPASPAVTPPAYGELPEPAAFESTAYEHNGRPAMDEAVEAAPEPLEPQPEPIDDPRELSLEEPVAAVSMDAGPVSPEVEALLKQAESEFHSGDRESATATLMRAAEGYESDDRLDSAAAIYRSLNRTSPASEPVLAAWLSNCEARGDAAEGAAVACQLGETAIAAGDWVAATTWFERAIALEPTHELAQRRLQRLNREGDAEPVDLSEVGKISLATGRSDVVPPELDSLLSEFRRGVESQIAGDAQSHYDLGMTYREMGLSEPAIEAFREAGRDRAFQQRCAEMIGRCLLDEGRFEEAIAEFETAVALPTFAPETLASLRFQLGLAHEAAGRTAEALDQFEQAAAAQPGFPDVAQKIRQLKRLMEQT